jgi:hypothetical protein
MASIQKRQLKNGQTSYVVKWRTPDGKHRTRGGFRTKKQAQSYATKVEHAQVQGIAQLFDPQAGGVAFRAVAQLWLQSRLDLKPTTLAGYAYALAPASACRYPRNRLGIDAALGGYPINAITRQVISDWVQTLATKT